MYRLFDLCIESELPLAGPLDCAASPPCGPWRVTCPFIAWYTRAITTAFRGQSSEFTDHPDIFAEKLIQA